MSDTFDPTAPEGDSGGNSQYMAKRDIKVILVIVVVCAICLIPVYKMLEKNGQKVVCSNNMGAISAALNQYAEQHDGQFPPVYEGFGQGYPVLDPKTNLTITWASAISPYMKSRASFHCPTAEPDESVMTISQRPIDTNSVQDRSRKFGQELLDYGFYTAYGAYPVSQVADPNQTIVIAETSNMGAKGSYDPVPYQDADGKSVPFNCFAIAWDTSNDKPDAKTKAVTRLAFYEVKSGDFQAGGTGRHNDFIHALTAGGSLVNLDAQSAIVQQRSGLVGRWAVPPAYGR